MTWFYAVGGEQKGPVDQSELARLIQQGVITHASLVWREGMADWQPYRQAVGQLVSAPAAGLGTGDQVCSECGRTFPPDQVIQLGAGFVCAACKPIAVQKLREGVGNSAAEQIRKEHLNHEASVKSVGLLYFLSAAFLLLAALFGLAFGDAGGLAIGLLFLVLGGVQIWVGIGLRRLNLRARVPTGILSGLGLLGFPIGTLINAYILYLVFSKKGATVFSDEYKQVIAATPHIKYRTSIIVWILLGLVLLLIVAGALAVFFAPRK